MGCKQLDIWLKLQLGWETLKASLFLQKLLSKGMNRPELVGVAALGTGAKSQAVKTWLGKLSTLLSLLSLSATVPSLRTETLLARSSTSLWARITPG